MSFCPVCVFKMHVCNRTGGGAQRAPFGVAMSPKRRVRAAHARPKPSSVKIYNDDLTIYSLSLIFPSWGCALSNTSTILARTKTGKPSKQVGIPSTNVNPILKNIAHIQSHFNIPFVSGVHLATLADKMCCYI